jgi:hypothetical protein
MFNHSIYSRRGFLQFCAKVFGVGVTSLSPAAFALEKPKVIAGALRWDAWYKRTDNSEVAQNNLSGIYKSRAPFFCNVEGDSIVCAGNQDEMDLELRFAAQAGLSYWAFDWYGNTSSLHLAWDLYQKSEHRSLINWCGSVSLYSLGSVPFSSGKWRSNIEEWAGYMEQQCYQKMEAAGISNRPLLYIQWDQSQFTNFFNGDFNNFKTAFEYLKNLTIKAGLGEPYVVILGHIADAELVKNLGADALSSYIPAFGPETVKGPYPYSKLDVEVQSYWRKLSETGVPCIPIALVGWDNRPRQEHPVPWERARKPVLNSTNYYEMPTRKQFQSHIDSAIDFIQSHPYQCPARTLLIYSWDECDEGGGMIPTLGDPKGELLIL